MTKENGDPILNKEELIKETKRRLEDTTGNELYECDTHSIQFDSEHVKLELQNLMLEKFSWIKVNTAGPDGIHPIITKLVNELEK